MNVGVAVMVGVTVGVLVGDWVDVGVFVIVGVWVGVLVGVLVKVGVNVSSARLATNPSAEPWSAWYSRSVGNPIELVCPVT